ncbi:hypothetical protein Misp02_35380 [Microtetraspora sp. NBRC 16547]|nr:hypothetical protein Misp02_35380 [Microtetraspora sp. NBRC 16547]
MDESNVCSFRVTGRDERLDAERIISGTSWETADVSMGELAVTLLPVASRSDMGRVVGRPAALHLRAPGYPGIPSYVAERIQEGTAQVSWCRRGGRGRIRRRRRRSCTRSRAASLTIARETWVAD